MAEIEGFKLLLAIGKNPEVFGFLKPDVNKSARSWFSKALKQKGLNLQGAKEIYKISGDDFERIVSPLSRKDLESIAKKLDEFNSDLKTADQNLIARHIIALCEGQIEPTAAPASKPKAPRLNKANRLRSKVAEEIRESGSTEVKELKPNKPAGRKRGNKK